MATKAVMRWCAWFAFGLALSGFVYFAGIDAGTSLMCHQMGYESARRGDGGVWLCVKTVTFWPGRDAR